MRREEKLKVAIIDTGIAPEQFAEADKIIIVGDFADGADKIGHGSIIFHTMRKKLPDAQIIVIKVADSTELSEESLIEGLKVAINENVDLVNLSMGMTMCEDTGEMSNICNEMERRGVILVSAFDNDGGMSYPAAFYNVIGVDISARCKLLSQFEYVESECVNIKGFSGVMRMRIGNKIYSGSGTSFACAIITAEIAKEMIQGVSGRENILNELREQAINIIKSRDYSPVESVLEIHNAILFPFNKEMYAMIANQELLSYSIFGVCDAYQMGKIGMRTSDILYGNVNRDFIISDILNLDWNLEFDTVILGHTRELSNLLKFNFKSYIINKCEQYNKKLYSFDSVESSSEGKVYTPKVLPDNVPKNRFGKLFQVHCPVLGIFGTSSKQGKYTLQLKLRKQFLKNGYKLVQLGTEPTAPLFGMDIVYPMGYEGIKVENPRDAILVINDLLAKSVYDETDIVIVGGQSGTGIYSFQNTGLFPIENYELLLGTQPDAVLLCVNEIDSNDYIDRTIKIIENMVDTKVIALVVSPLKQIEDDSNVSRLTQIVEQDHLIRRKEELERMFRKKTFILSFECDAQDIYKHCVETFQNGGCNE